MKADQGSGIASQPEKPEHYTYLKEFRTQQCPLFLQHKCTQHRPYTCFHWHFANQRRRRPMRKRDGAFNYTPDSYCSKYDETSGSCPNGDECQLLHRNSGDTERRYHVRYYKTASCVHETDSKGVCAKNGAHCAFAHGTQDLRSPTYDVREMQAIERGESILENSAGLEMSTSMEKERILNDDPKWNDSQYVLANYKTEPCKRPPRLCRQGYACPQFHNSKDRRRNPKVFKYRSTPCPQVKQHDEWGDPAVCDNGDNCQYCHTRTEQQFYPEIYKSTKCKDMVQSSYCPRGPFCAFAHVDQEINMTKDTQMDSPRTPNSLASYISPNSLQELAQHSPTEGLGSSQSADNHSGNGNCSSINNAATSNNNNSLLLKRSPIRHPPLQQGMNSPSYTDSSNMGGSVDAQFNARSSILNNKALSSSFSEALGVGAPCSVPEPIGKGRSQSMIEYQRSNSLQSRSTHSNTIGGQCANSYTGHEYGRMRQHSGDLSGSNTSSLLLDSGIGGFNNNSNAAFMSSTGQPNNMSPFAAPFFPAGDTVESVIGNAMEDLNLGSEFHHMTFAEDALDDRGDTASVCSSISAGLASSYMSNSFSLPMTIPGQGNSCNLSQSPPTSPLDSAPMGIPQSQNRPNRFSSLGSDLNPLISPRSSAAIPQSAILPITGSAIPSSSVFSNGLPGYDVTKLREELYLCKQKLIRWEEAMNQARSACDAWKKEAEEALRQRDEMRQQADYGSVLTKCAQSGQDVAKVPLHQLTATRKQLCHELDHINKLMEKKASGEAGECVLCHAPVNITTVSRSSAPCTHVLLCETCAIRQSYVCSICTAPSAAHQFPASNGENGSAMMSNAPVALLQSHMN